MSRLALVLERIVPRYSRPKKRLEQYRTPPELALEAANYLLSRSECRRLVVDMGSGTGMLSSAAVLLGALYSIGLEVDADAVRDAKKNPLYARTPHLELVVADALQPPLRRTKMCILENPPFGISSRRGIDREFLEASLKLEPRAIASFHSFNEESLKIFEKILVERGYRVSKALKKRFPIPALYETHSRRIYYAEVVLLIAEKSKLRNPLREKRETSLEGRSR